jgi:hypothetical protein
MPGQVCVGFLDSKEWSDGFQTREHKTKGGA